MPTTFDRYTLRTAQAIVSSRADDQATINIDYYNSDHWRNADGWVGPRPQLGDTTYTATLTAIEDAFVTRNVVKEVTGRHVSGVLARELEWGFTVKRPLGTIETTDPTTGQVTPEDEQPTKPEQDLIDEAEAALTDWWDEREIPEILQNMLACALNTKRGVLRLYVPPGMRDANGNLQSGDLTQTVNYLWLQHLGTNEDTLALQFPSATVYCDKLSRKDIGLFTYKSFLPIEADLFQPTATGPDRAEMTYLDDAGNTVLRVVEAQGDVEPPLFMPLGGRLTMYELTRNPLITPQIISQQKLLNMAMSMKQRNVVLGGFLERIFLNVKLPGTTSDGVFTPTPLQVGAGTLNSLQGETYEDRDGNTHVLPASVVYKDPIAPDTFIATEMSAYSAMLQECNQAHYLSAGETVVSGESRKQARDAFKADLLHSAGKVEAAGRWLLETSLAMAAYFAGTPGRFDELRAYVQCRVDSGPVGPDDLRVASEMADKQLWSKETSRSATGIEDVEAEAQRIQREQAEQQQGDAASLAIAQQALDRMRGGQPGQTIPVGQNGTAPTPVGA